MGVPGEELDKVDHYYHEPHPFFDCDLAVTSLSQETRAATAP